MKNESASVRPGFGLAWVVALAVLSVAATGDPRAQERERYTLSGDQVAIHDLAGEVRVEPGTGSAVVVEVVRGGRDAGALKVRTLTHRGMATLAVAFPGSRVVYPAVQGQGSTIQTVDDDGVFLDGGFQGGHGVRVSSSGSGTEAHADLRVYVPAGKKLNLYHAVGVAKVQGIQAGLMVDHVAGDLDVRGVKGDVNLDTGSGEVAVTDLRGDLVIDSGSGEVTLANLHGDALNIDSGSGEVHGTDVQVQQLMVDSGSGAVDFRGLSARSIRLDSGSGDVELDLDTRSSDIVVDSGSGRVTLRIPKDFGARYDIDGGSGGIELGVVHEAFSLEEDHVQGKIGDGRGSIRIDGGSGRVRIVPSGRTPSGRVGMLGSLLTHGVG
jgi:hypothetical protein